MSRIDYPVAPLAEEDLPVEGQQKAAEFYGDVGKRRFVRGVFDRIAGRYDLLNTVTSFGMHHLWRRKTVALSGLQPGGTALDIACGTGDFLPLLQRRVGSTGRVIGLDFSRNMLILAQAKITPIDDAILVQGDAERLPFGAESIDAVTIGFALRNLADVEACFREMRRVLVRGGRVLALEIARPGWWPYRPLFLYYFEKLLPRLATMFRGEETAYRWLPASLAAFYSREGVLRLMRQAGFEQVEVRDLAAGAVAIYIGVKP